MAKVYNARVDPTENDVNDSFFLFNEENIVTLVKHEMMMALSKKERLTNEKCIVWKTTGWRKTSCLGQYCTVEIKNTGFPLLRGATTSTNDNIMDKEDDDTWMKFIREKLVIKFTANPETGSTKSYKMNFNIFLVHVLFFKQLGRFAVGEYSVALMRNIMRSQYFIDNRLGMVVRREDLVKTASKSLKDEEKKLLIATKCQDYNFESAMSSSEVRNVYESKGHDGLLCVLEKELNYDIINFVIQMKKEYVRYVISYAEVVSESLFLVLYVFLHIFQIPISLSIIIERL